MFILVSKCLNCFQNREMKHMLVTRHKAQCYRFSNGWRCPDGDKTKTNLCQQILKWQQCYKVETILERKTQCLKGDISEPILKTVLLVWIPYHFKNIPFWISEIVKLVLPPLSHKTKCGERFFKVIWRYFLSTWA